MSNNRVYEVQQLIPFKGWKCLTKPRSDLGVALDEFRAHARTTSASARLRVLNVATGRVLRTHSPAKSTGKASSPSSEPSDTDTSGTSQPQKQDVSVPKRKRQPHSVSSSTAS